MSEATTLFSEGANNAICLLDPGECPGGDRRFPQLSDREATGLRVDKQESIAGWFRRVIGPDGEADGRIGQCGIDDNIAFFARVCWTKTGISFCCLQALVTSGGDLTDFYLGAKGTNATYYRLDFDPKAPGPLFAEPLPHVHCCPNGPPRFPFLCVSSEYLPISFLEFVYLNHKHETWLNWVKAVCALRGGEISVTSIADRYVQEGGMASMDGLATDVATLKTILRRAKLERVPKAPRLDDRILGLNYHTLVDGS